MRPAAEGRTGAQPKFLARQGNDLMGRRRGFSGNPDRGLPLPYQLRPASRAIFPQDTQGKVGLKVGADPEVVTLILIFETQTVMPVERPAQVRRPGLRTA